jgi:hypothetical protein
VGATGADGQNGATGAVGATGQDGATGAQGATGAPGATGSPGATGAPGATGSDGQPGATGAPGQDAPTTGTVSVTVNEGNGSGGIAGPLAGVTVTAETTSGANIEATNVIVPSATSDQNGAATLTLPYGVYQLTFTLANFTSPAPVQVGVVEALTVNVSVTMSEASSAKPTLTLVAAGTEIGYGNTVTVTATGTSPVGDTLTYTWKNTTSYGLGSVTGSGTSGTITTPTIAAAMAPEADPSAAPGQLGNFISGYNIPNTFGMFPIMNDTNGNTTATVTVSDGFGQSASASVSVTAASFQNTTHAAAVGTRVYLNPGSSWTAGSTWTLTTPSGSSASFDNASNQYPSFIPDIGGKYTATLGTNSFDIYAGSWMGVIGSGSTVTNTQNGTVPFGENQTCSLCHQVGGGGLALDVFSEWVGTKHAVHMTYAMDGVSGFSSGESCLGCHSVGFDNGNKNAAAGGLSEVAAAQTPPWVYPTTINSGNWAATPAAVQQLANIQCESCHGPQGNAAGGMSAGHTLTDVSGTHEPFQSPRISYAAEDCGTCHAAGTSHHHYSEWATLDSTRPGLNPAGKGHSNLAVAQSEGLTTVSGKPALNNSCGRCHTAQGYTEYVDNLQAGNVGTLSPTQQAAGQLSVNTVQPQTCQACHDPHADAVDPVTGEDEYQLRLWNNTPLLPSGFAAYGVGAGAVCISCHNSRNGAYNASAVDNSTTTAYLHEDTDWIGSNPSSSNAALVAANYPSLGTKFGSLGGPHEANQGDVFEGHNAYFLGDQTPVISPHSAVKDTCAGCHMEKNPQTYTSHGASTTATHLFAITDAETPALCNQCHGNGSSIVDGASLQASVAAGLTTITNNMAAAVVSRVNDATGAYTAPNGYGKWVDNGTITIAKGGLTDTTAGCTLSTDVSCGLSNAAAFTIVTGPSGTAGANPLVSAVVTPQGRSGITVVLTFTSPVSITFTGSVTNSLTTFTVASLANLQDASGNPLFAANGNMFKANWNWSLISQDESYGVHNPPFVSAVLSATADPPGDPWATPPSVPGLWY